MQDFHGNLERVISPPFHSEWIAKLEVEVEGAVCRVPPMLQSFIPENEYVSSRFWEFVGQELLGYFSYLETFG